MILDIVVTHYNEPWNICKPLIDMIHAQKCVDFSKFRVNIIHDGSSLFTQDKIEGPATIHQCKIKHSGVSTARNFGLKTSWAEWVQFCDIDDCFSSIYSLANIIYILESEESKQFDLMWGPFYMSNENFEQRTVTTNYNSVFIHNKFYRRSFLKEHNLKFAKNIHMSEDSAFNAVVKMEIDPHRIGQINTNEPLYAWCRRPGSITMDFSKWLYNTEGHFDRNLYVIEEYKKRGQTEVVPLIGRIFTDAYAMLTRSGVPEPSEEFKKRLSDYYFEHKKEIEELSDDILEQALAASDKDLGMPEENKKVRPPFKKWLNDTFAIESTP